MNTAFASPTRTTMHHRQYGELPTPSFYHSHATGKFPASILCNAAFRSPIFAHCWKVQRRPILRRRRQICDQWQRPLLALPLRAVQVRYRVLSSSEFPFLSHSHSSSICLGNFLSRCSSFLSIKILRLSVPLSFIYLFISVIDIVRKFFVHCGCN